jgi:tripartite-type tricarboxylate transporter receptor subunit TctC
MSKIIVTVFAFAALLFGASATAAETIKLVLPYPAGGLIDRAGREIQKLLNENTNYKFIIDYQSGAGGLIASTHVARAKNKETILLIHSGPTLIITSLSKNSPFRMTDLAPVAYAGVAPFVLVANKDNHINSIEKLLAANEQEPIFFTSSGVKTSTHLAGETLRLATNKNLIHVPMQGELNSLVEVLANRVSLSFVSVSTIKGHEDKLNILASGDQTRSKQLPDLPTLKEKGIKGFDSGLIWIGLYANTTADQKLIKEIQTVLSKELARPEVRAAFEKLGISVSANNVLKLDEISKAEEKRIQHILTSSNLE